MIQSGLAQRLRTGGLLKRSMHRRIRVADAPVKEMTGIVFKSVVDQVDDAMSTITSITSDQESLVRQDYVTDCEAAINEQINVEYNISYWYHAMYAYFDRDTVSLPNIAKYFKEQSEEERSHAEKLMNYQNKRGGKVVLKSINQPRQSDFNDAAKGDALYAFELSLSLEKLNLASLLKLHGVADKAGDVALCEFLEAEYISPQVDEVREVATHVSKLRRAGKGLGVVYFDNDLLD